MHNLFSFGLPCVKIVLRKYHMRMRASLSIR